MVDKHNINHKTLSHYSLNPQPFIQSEAQNLYNQAHLTDLIKRYLRPKGLLSSRLEFRYDVLGTLEVNMLLYRIRWGRFNYGRRVLKYKKRQLLRALIAIKEMIQKLTKQPVRLKCNLVKKSGRDVSLLIQRMTLQMFKKAKGNVKKAMKSFGSVVHERDIRQTKNLLTWSYMLPELYDVQKVPNPWAVQKKLDITKTLNTTLLEKPKHRRLKKWYKKAPDMADSFIRDWIITSPTLKRLRLAFKNKSFPKLLNSILYATYGDQAIRGRGIKIRIAGRMTRSLRKKRVKETWGQTRTQTKDVNVDDAFTTVQTRWGIWGVKVKLS